MVGGPQSELLTAAYLVYCSLEALSTLAARPGLPALNVPYPQEAGHPYT